MTKPKVLFLCTGNSARSQMAEAFLRNYAPDRFEAFSAGIEPKGIHMLTIKVLAEKGLDISGQSSKGVEEYLGKLVFAHVITLCGDADENCPSTFLTMGKKEHWPLDDPSKFDGADPEKLDRFRIVRDQIEARVLSFIKENTP